MLSPEHFQAIRDRLNPPVRHINEKLVSVDFSSVYAHAYTDVKALVGEVERLRAENRDLRATLEESASNGGLWPV